MWAKTLAGDVINLNVVTRLTSMSMTGGYYVVADTGSTTTYTVSGPYTTKADADSAAAALVSDVRN